MANYNTIPEKKKRKNRISASIPLPVFEILEKYGETQDRTNNWIGRMAIRELIGMSN